MITPKMIRSLNWCIDYAQLFKIIPYHWDRKNQILTIPDSKRRLAIWYFFIFALLLHLLYVIIELRGCIVTKAFTTTFYVAEFLYMFGFLLTSVFQITLLLKWKEFAVFVNFFLHYFKNIHERYSRRDAPIVKNKSEKTLQLYVLLSIFQPIMIHVSFYFMQPDTQLFIQSKFIPTNSSTANYPLWLFICNGLPTLGLLCTEWATGGFFFVTAVIYLYGIEFILEKLKANNKDLYMKPSFQQPSTLMHTLRCLQVLNIQLNNVIRHYILVVANTLAIVDTVTCNVLLVRLSANIPPVACFAAFILSCGGMSYIIFSYARLGTINKKSEALMKSWKNNLSLRTADRLFLTKYLKSCKPLRMEYGSFGYYRKPATVKVIGMLIAYTAKALIITRHYFIVS